MLVRLLKHESTLVGLSLVGCRGGPLMQVSSAMGLKTKGDVSMRPMVLTRVLTPLMSRLWNRPLRQLGRVSCTASASLTIEVQTIR